MPEWIKKHDPDICLSCTQTSAISEHANVTGHMHSLLCGTRLSLLIVTHIGTFIGFKRPFT